MMVVDQNRHIPPGHRPVEQPTADTPDYISHARSQHGQPVRHLTPLLPMSRHSVRVVFAEILLCGIEIWNSHRSPIRWVDSVREVDRTRRFRVISNYTAPCSCAAMNRSIE